ncbi:MAG: type III pantothenate kinase [Anaerolineae bacterium]
MLLAIDIGNTNVHLGVWHEGSWRLSWRARTVADKMPDEYAVLVRNFLSTADVPSDAIEGVIISSVVPPLTQAFCELSRRYLKQEPLVVRHDTPTGVTLDIDQPEQAGADRIVNAAAIVAYHRYPSIVIDFGTATTFDVISAEGALIGVAIAPGVGLAHDALVSRAARLHKVDLEPPPSPIGKNTIHAMQSGIFWGYVGLVEGLVARIKSSMPDPEITVYATGGLATVFNEHTDMIDHIIPELTLDGLYAIYQYNRPVHQD